MKRNAQFADPSPAKSSRVTRLSVRFEKWEKDIKKKEDVLKSEKTEKKYCPQEEASKRLKEKPDQEEAKKNQCAMTSRLGTNLMCNKAFGRS
ncbi:hypothetical protein Btru_020450 [Bulinus truncatus]|nr:hypothetical protein Btru_020450 [Bulinus truncatus]